MNHFLTQTLLMMLLVFFVSHNSAQARTFIVTKTADTDDGVCDSDCSLREAFSNAEGVNDEDTIKFDETVFSTPQTIALINGSLHNQRNKRLTVEGPGANLLTIDGGRRLDYVFFIYNNITLKGLKITGGGIGVYCGGDGYGQALLIDLIITGNSPSSYIRSGGGVYIGQNANVIIANSIITNNSADYGGGVSSSSLLTAVIINSTISNNTATFGGGGVAGRVNVINSTISRNTVVNGNGGGVYGGVYIANSTITGNSANMGSGGGVAYPNRIINSTIANNTARTVGGVLSSNFNGEIANTIIADNIALTRTSPDVAGKFNSQGFNLIGNDSNSEGWTTDDLLNQPAGLAPLGNNGGRTQTYALLPTSAAINRGNNELAVIPYILPAFELLNDQRGKEFARIQGGRVDIGAFEVGSVPAPLRTINMIATISYQGRDERVYHAQVTLVNAETGETYFAQTNPFGFCSLKVPSDEIYFVYANHKRLVNVDTVLYPDRSLLQLSFFYPTSDPELQYKF